MDDYNKILDSKLQEITTKLSAFELSEQTNFALKKVSDCSKIGAAAMELQITHFKILNERLDEKTMRTTITGLKDSIQTLSSVARACDTLLNNHRETGITKAIFAQTNHERGL